MRFLAAAVLLFSLQAAAAPTRRVALLAVEKGPGVAAGAATSLEQGLEDRLHALEGIDVLPARAMADILGAERAKQLIGVHASALSGLLGGNADEVLFTRINRGEATYVIEARRVDVRSGKVVQRKTVQVPEMDTQALLDAPGTLVAALWPDDRPRAAVAPPAPALTPQVARPIRVAALEVRRAGDVPDRAFAALNQSISPELRKIEGVSAISSAELNDMLSVERQKQLLGCSDDESSCLSEIAGALDADEAVSMQLTLVGSTYALTARRSDLRRAKVLQTVLKKFEKRDGEELLSIVGPTIGELYPDRPLKPGRSRGVEAALVRRLNPPPLPKWTFYATAGGALVAGAAAGALGYLALDTQHQYDQLAARSVQTPVSGPDLTLLEQRSRSQAGEATAVAAVAGGLALTAAVEFFFTDWHDDRAAFSAQAMILSGGAGAGLAARFQGF